MKSVLMLICLLFTFPAFAKSLTVYTYDSFVSEWGPGPQLKTAFEKQCGCELNFVGLEDGVSILNRLKLEKGKTKADVVLGLDNNLMAESRDLGLFTAHKQDLSFLSLPQAWADDTFVPFDYGYFAFIYNSEKLKQPPASLSELIESDISVIYQDPRTSTPGLGLMLWLQSVYPENASEQWQKLAKHTVAVSKDWWGAYEMFLKGESDMVLSYTTSPAYHQIVEEDSKYKAAKFSEGHYMQIEVAAALAASKEPELAKAFLAFLVSKEAQKIIPVTNWMLPVRSDVELPAVFNELIKVDTGLQIPAEKVAKQRRLWINQWRDALVK